MLDAIHQPHIYGLPVPDARQSDRPPGEALIVMAWVRPHLLPSRARPGNRRATSKALRVFARWALPASATVRSKWERILGDHFANLPWRQRGSIPQYEPVGPISKPDHFVDATATRLQRRG